MMENALPISLLLKQQPEQPHLGHLSEEFTRNLYPF